jgi:RNA polymerase sigma factor (sigma-70 family)
MPPFYEMLFSLKLNIDLLFQRHQMELLKFAGQHSNQEVAEDLVQEAYLRLLRQAQTETIDNPRAYLYTITRNLSADYLRQNQVRSRHQIDSDIEVEHVADEQPGPHAEVEAQFRLQHCLDALDSLPEIYRHVFLLHRIDGMTYAEIGKALQLTTRTVERYAAKVLAHCFAKTKDDL